MNAKIHVLTLTSLLFAVACDPSNKGETDSDSGSTSSSTSSTTEEQPTTGAATDGGGTDGGGTSQDGETTGGDSEGDTTGAETTGPLDPEAESACKAYCEQLAACGLESDVAICVSDCGASFQELPGECVAPNQALVSCAAELSCQQQEEQLDEGPCADELAALFECTGEGPKVCSQGLTEGEEECGLITECEGEPTREMQCDTETCVCLEGGVEVGQCPSEGVCTMGDAIFDKRATCCDFG